MNLTRRGTVWWVDFRLPTGRRVRRSTFESNEAAARKKAPTIVAEECAAAGATVSNMTLGQALRRTLRDHWEGTRSARAMRHMVDRLEREVGYWPVADATYAKLKDYGEGLRRDGLAHATINRRMSAIGVALRDCVRRGEMPAKPDLPHWREDNRKERYMSPDEEAAVSDWLKRGSLGELYGHGGVQWTTTRLFFLVLLDTGLRFSEVFKAKLTGRALALAHGETKNDKGRVVPLTERALEAWQTLVSMPQFKELVEMGDDAAWSWVSYRWEKATEACGCRDVTLHVLRHTCASRLVQRGVPLYTVSKWLGHSSIKVTERYAHLSPDNMALALAALERKPQALRSADAHVESLHDTTSSHKWSDSPDVGHRQKA